jgi:tellurite resistance protein
MLTPGGAMKRLRIDPTVFHFGLRALKTVALADGTFDDSERGLMVAALRALAPDGAADVDLDALETISVDELAAGVEDELSRTRVIQAMLVTAMVDTEIDEREYALIKEFAKALDVDEPRLRNLKQLLEHHHTLVKFDLNRAPRMITDAVKHAYAEGGVRGAYRTVVPFFSKTLALDDALARKYRRLGLLPEGTFGRAYWVHMCERGFGFPGEAGAFPAEFIKHDCCHVLGGYDTDALGECEVISFICGFMKADPFWYLFMIVVHMHLGIETFHKNAGGFAAFDSDRCLKALARGARVNTDVYVPGFDWWALFPEPIETVRGRFNVLDE